MCSARIHWATVVGSRTHPAQVSRPRWWPATRSSSRPGRLSDPPAQRPWRRQAVIYRSRPWPRGIIRAFRLQCPAMFLLADLVGLVRRPFTALRTIDQRRSLAAGLAKLVGYAALVGLVALPVALVDALLKLQGATQAEAAFGQLAGFVAVAIFLWQNALLVIAARDHYAISTQRAVAAVIGPIGAV